MASESPNTLLPLHKKRLANYFDARLPLHQYLQKSIRLGRCSLLQDSRLGKGTRPGFPSLLVPGSGNTQHDCTWRASSHVPLNLCWYQCCKWGCRRLPWQACSWHRATLLSYSFSLCFSLFSPPGTFKLDGPPMSAHYPGLPSCISESPPPPLLGPFATNCSSSAPFLRDPRGAGLQLGNKSVLSC